MAKSHPLFTIHDRLWRDNLYVYPVISRRSRGLSIGVNLNPDKVCNFDCIYCCVDRKTPPAVNKVDFSALERELEFLLDFSASGEIFNIEPFDQTPEPLKVIRDIAFSGDGEPTSHPKFEEACEIAARALENRRLNDVKIVVITNATLFHQPRVKKAFEFLDAHHGEIWAKLDAGTEAYFHQVERTKIPFKRVLENILGAGRIRPLVIQSLFMKIDGEGPSEGEIGEYLKRLNELKPGIKEVQVYTTARRTAMGNVTALGDGEIDHIVRQVKELGVKASGYYGAG
jgi:wyosine [tRNA(Phe)-imidazoG37] synthetase (radical SAM superfamily)